MSLFGDENYYFNEAAKNLEMGIKEKGIENIENTIELACDSFKWGINNALSELIKK